MGARAPAFGAPPAGGCPRRMAGRGTEFYGRPGPAALPRGRDGFQNVYVRPSTRRAAARRGGATGSASAGGASLRKPVPHGVAASVKYWKSCRYFCREQSRPSEGIAVAMARMVNAVIGKKNKTWCAYFMLAATPSRARRAVRSNAARVAAVC